MMDRRPILLTAATLLALHGPGVGAVLAQAAAPGATCPGNPAALGTSRTLLIDPSTPVRVGLKTYPQTLDLGDHEVVLTFDDGPSAKTTPRVLEALEHDCVRAAFFLIGRNAQTSPALVKREIADGDTVGHHTWSHPEVTERGLSDLKARSDIEHGFAADDKAGYGTADRAPRVAFFRFPGFADTPALLDWLAKRHVAVFGADLWASDWVKQTPEAELALVMKRLNQQGRGIILLHDIKPQTADMIPALLKALKDGNYRIVAIAPGRGPTPLRAAPAGWTSETEKTLEALWPKLMRPEVVPAPETQPFVAPTGTAVDDLPIRASE